MKLHLIRSTLLIALGLSFTACEQSDNFLGKKGMQCDSKEIVALTEQILNNQVLKNGNLKIDSNNIVVWDYNKVGRYYCKAKVNGINNDNKLNPYLLIQYGLSFDSKTNQISGWVNYNTYKTTQGGGYYVQIETKEN